MKTNWLTECVKAHATLLGPNEIPVRYQNAKLSNIPHPQFVKAAKDYGTRFWEVAPQGFAPLLLGAAGEYKTFTAAAIAQAIRDRFLLDIGWCSCAAEFTRFDREAFDSATGSRLEFLKTVPFLVMDDFTQVSKGTRMMNTMVEVGSVRYDNMRPTLWTGNIVLAKNDAKALTDLVGACLARRILDTSAGFRAQVRSQ